MMMTIALMTFQSKSFLSSQDPDDCAQKFAFWQPCITMIDRPAAPWDNPRPPSELILRGGAIKAGVKYWKSILVIFLSFPTWVGPTSMYFPSGKS